MVSPISGIVQKRHVQPGEKVAFDSPIYVCRAFDSSGDGYNSDVAACIHWLADRTPARMIINMSFTVDPGKRPGDTTSMYVTYYNVNKPSGELSVFEKFTLQRKRSDG